MANILIVLTDGRSTDKQATLAAAAELHKTNVNVFAIGVGSNVDQAELEAIASKPQNVFNVQNFDALDNIQANLKRTACEGKFLCWFCMIKIYDFFLFWHIVCGYYQKRGDFVILICLWLVFFKNALFTQ